MLARGVEHPKILVVGHQELKVCSRTHLPSTPARDHIPLRSSEDCRTSLQLLDRLRPSRTVGHVRFGSKADICSAPTHVRFTPNSDRKSGFSQKSRRRLLRHPEILPDSAADPDIDDTRHLPTTDSVTSLMCRCVDFGIGWS